MTNLALHCIIMYLYHGSIRTITIVIAREHKQQTTVLPIHCVHHNVAIGSQQGSAAISRWENSGVNWKHFLFSNYIACHFVRISFLGISFILFLFDNMIYRIKQRIFPAKETLNLFCLQKKKCAKALEWSRYYQVSLLTIWKTNRWIDIILTPYLS